VTSKDFITKTMAEATTMFEVFDKIVAKMDADAAKIAELEARLAGLAQALSACYAALRPKDSPVEASE
jgi:hypothetical protein